MLYKNTELNMELRVINAIAHKEDLLRYLLPGSDVLTSLLKTWSFEIFRYYVEGDRLELIVEAKYENEIDYLLGSHGISPSSKETGIGFVIPVGVGINLDPGFLAKILELCAGMELIRVNHTERSIELMMPSRQVKECVRLLHDAFIGENS